MHVKHRLFFLVFLTRIEIILVTDGARIAILERLESGKGDLKLYMTRKGTLRDVATNLSLVQDVMLTMCSHAPSGIICWLAQLVKGKQSEIHCYNLRTNSKSTLLLPVQLTVEPASSNYSTLGRKFQYQFHIEMDLYGNNIYWGHPETGNIWGTSLKSGVSKIILQDGETKGESLRRAMSQNKGYMFESLIKVDSIRFIQRSGKFIERPRRKLSFELDVSGLAIANELKKMYWISFNTLCSSPYDEYDMSGVGWMVCPPEDEMLHLPSLSTQSTSQHLYLQYYNSHLYWLDLARNGYVQGNILDLTTNKIQQVDVGYDKVFAISLYENQLSSTEENPCLALNCTHLCIPIDETGYKCCCPSGMSLVNSSICVSSPGILTFYASRNSADEIEIVLDSVILVSAEHTLGGQLKVSQEHLGQVCPENKTATEHWFCTVTGIPEQRMQDLVAFDPSGKHFIMSSPHCLTLHSATTSQRKSYVLQCISEGPLTSLGNVIAGVDFLNWILFWAVSSSNGDSRSSIEEIRYRSFPFEKGSGRILLGTTIISLAVDPQRKMLYWSTPENSIVTANYDGGEARSELYLKPAPYSSSRANLMFHENLLLWLHKQDQDVGKPCNPLEIIAYDIETKRKTSLLNAPCTWRAPTWTQLPQAIIIPQVLTQSDPCAESNCTHICIPTSRSSYLCACPEPLVFFENVCHSPELILIYTDSSKEVGKTYVDRIVINENKVEQIHRHARCLQLAFEIDYSKNTIVATRQTNKELPDICLFIKGQPEFDCFNLLSNTTKSFRIHPNSSMLVFDPTGSEYFYNDEETGKISVSSIATKTIFQFPEFQAQDVTVWTLDTLNKIFFWCDRIGNEEHMRFKVLHQNNAGSKTNRLGHVIGLAPDMASRVLYIVRRDSGISRVAYEHLQPIFENSDESLTFSYPDQYPSARPSGAHFSILLQNHFLFLLFNVASKNSSRTDVLVGFNVLNNMLNYLSEIPDGQVIHQVLGIGGPPGADQTLFPCTSLNCSHFCFPISPLLGNSTVDLYCECPEGWALSPGDERTCAQVETGEPANTTLLASLISISVVLAILLIASFTTGIVWKRRKQAELDRLVNEIKNGTQEDALTCPLKIIIAPSELTVNEKIILGEGAYGLVLQGIYKNKTVVAVKTLKRWCSLTTLKDFAKEVKIMNYVGYHPHVVRFYGAEISNINKGTFYAVMEFSPLGSLIAYLRDQKEQLSDPPPDLVQFQEAVDLDHLRESQNIGPSIKKDLFVRWSRDIARGMEYLSSKSVVHGDLAARNVLVFDNNTLKLSDFGLARNLDPGLIYKKKHRSPLPWRWMPPESVLNMQFSTKSDVWSYGVTLWEILTFGQTPYAQYQCDRKFIRLLRKGLTLEPPSSNLPENLYDLILKPCWHLDPCQRPTFSQILHNLDLIMPISESINSMLLQSSSVDYEVIESEL